MSDVQALGAENITTIGIVVILVLVVLGFVISLLITAIVARVVIAVVVIALAVLVWQQRGHVRDNVNKHACNLHTTFFGVHVDPSDSVRKACANARS